MCSVPVELDTLLDVIVVVASNFQFPRCNVYTSRQTRLRLREFVRRTCSRTSSDLYELPEVTDVNERIVFFI